MSKTPFFIALFVIEDYELERNAWPSKMKYQENKIKASFKHVKTDKN